MGSAVKNDRSTVDHSPSITGWIVRSRGNDLGPGKVITADRDFTSIEYFYGPGKREIVRVPTASVSRVRLDAQTRCYLYSEGEQRWTTGRIKASYDGEFEIDLPDRRSIFVAESEVYVRCAMVGDAMDSLLVRGHETVFFHAPRTKFVRSVLRQRAGYRGLTALASAPIELYPHQVEVVRRVLEDPVQRYLLADEVGLGKTVEAGVIIRQHLLDSPLSKVLVIAPDSLVEQWRRELASRIGLPVGKLVHVCTPDEARAGVNLSVGMVVVDEAHHIAADAFSSSRDNQQRFAQIARIAHDTERVLLLSATPASNNEQQFLAMLHLLDPQTYKLDDLDGFRERVAKRQEIGRLLLTLRDDADPFVLKLALGKLREVFPRDTAIVSISASLQSLLAAEGDPRELPAHVRRLRAHISETYRIHRRMLRNRRAEWDGTLLARRASDDGVYAPFVIADKDARVAEAHDIIDDWRAYAWDALSSSMAPEGERLTAENATVALLHLFLQCASTSLTQLEALVTARLEGSSHCAALESEAECRTVLALSAPRFSEEAAILQRLRMIASRPAECPTRSEQLAAFLQQVRNPAGIRPPSKCVVFCPNNTVSIAVASTLGSRLGRRAVTLVTATTQNVPEAINNFQSNRDCFVLVADQVVEEGLNLQFAEYLVLFDIPWSPNRLEQRIGRLDRIGRTRPVRTVVFLSSPGPNSMYEAWLEVLRDGLRIFQESTAGLQFFIEEKLPNLSHALLSEGAHGLRSEITSLQSSIAAEQIRLREQAALDEIDAHAEHTSRFFRSLDDLDAEADLMQQAFEGWACKVLKFEKTRSGLQDHVAEYAATNYSLVPAAVMREGIASQLEKKCTFRRDIAVAGDGVSLVRVGHGLVESLWRYVQWDDRGRAYAIWRHEPSADPSQGAEWLGFKLHYLVEADANAIRKAVEALGLPAHAWRAIQRRADAVLPPFAEVLYFDVHGREVTDPQLLACLRRPAQRVRDQGTDTNLHKDRLGILDSLIAPGHWEWACKTVRSASEEELRARQTFREVIANASREAVRQVESEAASLAARTSAGRELMVDSLGAAREAEIQNILGRTLISAIANPIVRLDSVGFIVVSGRPVPVAL